MTTDDLITGLGAELSPVRPGLLYRSVFGGLTIGICIAVLVFALVWGLRPDAAAFADPFVAAKTALPFLLAGLALPIGMAAARPGGRSGLAGALWLVPSALAALVAAELLATPLEQWGSAFAGNSIITCLTSIPLLSAPILAGLLATLRRGAPEAPARCGAVAGLVAGGFGAGIYSLYCTEGSPLFYGFWYALAIAGVTAAAAILGHRLLRW